MKVTEKRIDEVLSDVAEEADLTRRNPYPSGTGGRRGQRGVVLSVRLSEGEHAALVEAAADAELPPSTLVRSLVQDYLGGAARGRRVALRIQVDRRAGAYLHRRRTDRFREAV